MSPGITALRDWFGGRKPNEQVLILLGALALVYVVADNLLMTPMTTYQKKLKEATDRQYKHTTKLRTELQVLYRDDPEIARRQVLDKLEDTQLRLKNEEKALAKVEKNLVGPQQIMDVLGGLLRTQSAVSIDQIENLPVVSLRRDDSKSTDAVGEIEVEKVEAPKKKDLITKVLESGDSDTLGTVEGEEAEITVDQVVFRHSLRVTLRGKYVDILRFLQTVETLPWRIFWDALVLESVEYPVSLVTVEFHTLSTDEAWFKVS